MAVLQQTRTGSEGGQSHCILSVYLKIQQEYSATQAFHGLACGGRVITGRKIVVAGHDFVVDG
jgi:hypothetical protein